MCKFDDGVSEQESCRGVDKSKKENEGYAFSRAQTLSVIFASTVASLSSVSRVRDGPRETHKTDVAHAHRTAAETYTTIIIIICV